MGMFAITGISGQVGGEVARNLLAAHQTVRGVARDISKCNPWAERGCHLVNADINDAAALAAAFQGVDGAFILVPPNFDPSPDFSEARTLAATLSSAIDASRPRKVVYLSTIGAQATRSNLLTQHTIIERELRKLSMAITFLRPAWFMENSTWDVTPAKNGAIQSFLQPLDKPVPMVATSDIGRVAAQLLQETWNGHRVIELEGPHRVTPTEIATTFANLLGRPVTLEAVPREAWKALFKSQGMKNPEPRIQMLDGFNEGWIEFEGKELASRKGKVPIETVLRSLIERDNAMKALSSAT
jgi:NAD(P)H dehydrogenase (quinone)